jgi:glycosyltransferase involved in cell wall biosynthesis
MRLRSLGKADTWRGLWLEAATARHQVDDQRAHPVSWTLPADLRRRGRLVWPRVYDWEHAHEWMDSLVDGFARHLQVEYADIPQRFRHVVNATMVLDGVSRAIAVDYSDYPEVDEACLDEVDRYFKMQFRASGYPSERVVPGGFVPRGRDLYRYLSQVRAARVRRAFRSDVFGAFSANKAQDVRQRALALLTGQKLFRFDGGSDLLRYSSYLQKVARSRVCVDLPGYGPLCFRLVEYLAVGSCVVAAPHAARLHVPLVDGEHLVYTSADLSDLPDVAAALVADDDERERLARNAREYFDRYLHPTQLAAYYLATALDSE